jgi:hypothetical protein
MNQTHIHYYLFGSPYTPHIKHNVTKVRTEIHREYDIKTKLSSIQATHGWIQATHGWPWLATTVR